MHIDVPRTHTHGRAHRVATAVEEKVRKTLPNSDVLVHVDAIESSSETIIDRIRLIATEIEGIRNVHSIIYPSTLANIISYYRLIILFITDLARCYVSASIGCFS
jgi:hypothetical protein